MNRSAVMSLNGLRCCLYNRTRETRREGLHDVSYTPFLLMLVNKTAGMETALVSKQCSANGCCAHGRRYKEPTAQLFDLHNKTIFEFTVYIFWKWPEQCRTEQTRPEKHETERKWLRRNKTYETGLENRPDWNRTVESTWKCNRRD